jgi:hypothetical protein
MFATSTDIHCLAMLTRAKNIISLVFFITYFLFQIPSTVVVREVGPRIHLGTITLLWVG